MLTLVIKITNFIYFHLLYTTNNVIFYNQAIFMKIKCTSCGYREEVNTRPFIRIIGGVMPFGGYWAWVTYFFCWYRFCHANCYRHHDRWGGFISILK